PTQPSATSQTSEDPRRRLGLTKHTPDCVIHAQQKDTSKNGQEASNPQVEKWLQSQTTWRGGAAGGVRCRWTRVPSLPHCIHHRSPLRPGKWSSAADELLSFREDVLPCGALRSKTQLISNKPGLFERNQKSGPNYLERKCELKQSDSPLLPHCEFTTSSNKQGQ
ncbi:hypothetical protein KUCAC02_031804, partial [Chaenocephalus aceratus]